MKSCRRGLWQIQVLLFLNPREETDRSHHLPSFHRYWIFFSKKNNANTVPVTSSGPNKNTECKPLFQNSCTRVGEKLNVNLTSSCLIVILPSFNWPQPLTFNLMPIKHISTASPRTAHYAESVFCLKYGRWFPVIWTTQVINMLSLS